MAITTEFSGNNDQRLERCVPVLDLYLHDYSDDYRKTPDLIMPYIRKLKLHAWLDEANAHILVEERCDNDLDAMVMVCYAELDDERRTMHVLSNDDPVEMMWEFPKQDPEPYSWNRGDDSPT